MGWPSINLLKAETEAFQAEAKAALQQAEEAIQKVRMVAQGV